MGSQERKDDPYGCPSRTAPTLMRSSPGGPQSSRRTPSSRLARAGSTADGADGSTCALVRRACERASVDVSPLADARSVRGNQPPGLARRAPALLAAAAPGGRCGTRGGFPRTGWPVGGLDDDAVARSCRAAAPACPADGDSPRSPIVMASASSRYASPHLRRDTWIEFTVVIADRRRRFAQVSLVGRLDLPAVW